MLPNRVQNRSVFTSLQYDKAEKKYRETIAIAHRIQDTLDFLETIPRWQYLRGRYSYENAYENRKYCARFDGSALNEYLYVYLYNIPLEKAIEEICGPIHRHHNVDWTMDVKGSGDVWLHTRINEYKEDGLGFHLHIVVNKGVPKCEIVEEVSERSYTVTKHRMICS